MSNETKRSKTEIAVAAVNIAVGVAITAYNVYAILRDKRADEKRAKQHPLQVGEVWELNPEWVQKYLDDQK